MALSISLDGAQRRLKRDRISMTAGGSELDGDVWEDTWIEPTTQTLMLRPAVAYPGYHRTSTGLYAKLRKSDLTLTSADWVEQEKLAVGDWWLTPATTTNETVCTTSTYGVNRGFVISFFVFSPGNDQDTVLLDCGWGDTLDYLSGVSIRFYTNGRADVWREGEFRGSYSLGSLSGSKFTDLLLLPIRRRELMVLSSGGQSFVHVFSEIPEDDPAPVIVPNEKFWLQVPNGRPTFQIAPVKFPTSGYATSLPIQLADAPVTGAVLETWGNDAPAAAVTNARVLADPAFAGTTGVSFSVVGADGVSAFTPNGTLRDCRIKLTLTGDGSYSPFVYGAHAAYESAYELTDDSEETDISDWPMADNAPTIEVPDDPFGVRFRMEFNKPEEVDDVDIPGLLMSSDRPIFVNVDECPVLDGVTLPPEFVWGTDDEGSRGILEARDYAALLESYTFRERVPLDGLKLSSPTGMSAVRFVLERAGFTFDTDPALTGMLLEDVDFYIPEIPSKDSGDFNFLIEVGDTAASVLQRLHETFAAGFMMGNRPSATGLQWVFLDPDTMPTTPLVTLYPNQDAADAASAVDPQFYGGFRARALEIEANEVRVTGLDPRSGQPVQAFIEDAASKNPTTAPSLRPDNWVGNPRIMGVLDPRITSEEAAVRCAEYLMPVVSQRRFAAEWTCLWPVIDGVPVWRGDVVTLDGRGDFRISSISATFVTSQVDLSWAECRMTGVLLGSGNPFGLGGNDLASIVAVNRSRARNRIIRRPGWEQVAKFLNAGIYAA